MIKKLVVFAFAFLMMFSFASAKISISAPDDLYNLGDKLYVTVSVLPSVVSGNFEIVLNCASQNAVIYRVPSEASFTSNEEQTISTFVTLTKDYIGNLSGTCYISSSLGTDTTTTKTFVITNNVNLEIKLDKTAYNPGEEITLEINAIKANGHPLNGFVEGSGAFDFSKVVEVGKVIEKFAMPKTIEAGSYNIELFVYDRDNNNKILNSVIKNVSFSINQIASSIVTSLSELEVEPGNQLKIGTEIYDQAGNLMGGAVSVKITSPSGAEIQKSIKSGEFGSIDFAVNATPGNWVVYSLFNGVSEEKGFSVKEVPKVEFEFIDSILVVRNVGNAVYNKPISVNIGDNAQELDLNIMPGEERRFNLKGKGEYDVQVSDGDLGIQRKLFLTGGAVSVDSAEGFSFFKNYTFVWIFIILILALTGVVLFLKFKNKSFRLSDKFKKMPGKFKREISETMHFTNKSPSAHSFDDNDDSVMDFKKKENPDAESTLVLKGDKSNSSVICITADLDSLGENSRKVFLGIVESAKERKGAVEATETGFRVIFSALLTKTFNNEMLAVKTAEGIMKKVNEFNRLHQDKIELNIGINSGDLVAALEQGKLKYTNIDSTVTFANKLSETGKGKVLISEAVRRKLMRDVKVERKGEINKKAYYELLRVADTEANKEKLKDIMKRMKNN